LLRGLEHFAKWLGSEQTNPEDQKLSAATKDTRLAGVDTGIQEEPHFYTNKIKKRALLQLLALTLQVVEYA
jgi:hypothetical protein